MLKAPTGCGKTRFVEHMAWSEALVDLVPRRPDRQ
jgi:MoxR-like ATPase